MKVNNITEILNIPGVWIEKDIDNVMTAQWFVTPQYDAIYINKDGVHSPSYTKTALEDLMKYIDTNDDAFTWELAYQLPDFTID